MKKLFSILLSLMMLATIPCPGIAETPVEITILLEGSTVTRDEDVLALLNPYLAEKIGVTVKPVWGTWANFNDLASNAINAGSDE